MDNSYQQPLFDHERLHVYQLLLRFIAWTTLLLKETKHEAWLTREVRDHLERASLSALLNTAEGNGKRQGEMRARFFDDARGSTTECAACLDALVAKGVCAPGRISEGKTMLVRVVQMLTKLIPSYPADDGMVHEAGTEYRMDDGPE